MKKTIKIRLCPTEEQKKFLDEIIAKQARFEKYRFQVDYWVDYDYYYADQAFVDKENAKFTFAIFDTLKNKGFPLYVVMNASHIEWEADPSGEYDNRETIEMIGETYVTFSDEEHNVFQQEEIMKKYGISENEFIDLNNMLGEVVDEVQKYFYYDLESKVVRFDEERYIEDDPFCQYEQ